MFGKNGRGSFENKSLEGSSKQYSFRKQNNKHQYPASTRMDIESNLIMKSQLPSDHILFQDYEKKNKPKGGIIGNNMDIEKALVVRKSETGTHNETIKNKLLDVFSILLSDLDGSNK